MKRLIFIEIVSISLFLFTACVWAETSIKAEVDKTKITTEETLTYKLTITSSDKKISSPQLPKFEGFSLVSQAQSSTMSFVKSNIKTILVYAYILAPTDIGKFKIGPSVIKIKDKAYSTEAFEIEVIPGKTRPKTLPKEKPSSPKKLPSEESEQPQITL